MKKRGLIITIAVIAVIFVGGMGALSSVQTREYRAKENALWKNGADREYSNGKYTKKLIRESEAIDSIRVDCTTADVEIYNSEDESWQIEYYEGNGQQFKYSCQNGTLKIQSREKRYLNRFFFGNEKYDAVRVYVPMSFQGEMEVELTSGDFNNEGTNLNLSKLTIKTRSGEIDVSQVEAESANFDLTSGDAEIRDCKFSHMLTVDAHSGDVETNGIEVNHMDVQVNSGNLELGVIGQPEDYTLTAQTNSGGISIRGNGTNVNEEDRISLGSGDKIITAETTSGDIDIFFE